MPAPASLTHASSSLLSHNLQSHTTSSNTSSHSRHSSWNTAAKLSSKHLALTHRHRSPRCSPASSDQRAGSRAFLVLAPLLPEHPAWAGPLAGHSQQPCSTSVWGKGGKGIPRPKLLPGATGCCPQATQFLFLPPFSPESLTMRGEEDCSSSAAQRVFTRVQTQAFKAFCSCLGVA